MYRRIKAVICLLLCINIISSIPGLVRAQAVDTEQENTGAQVIIYNIDDFLEFAEKCRLDSYSHNLTVKLRTDIDLSGTAFDGIPTFGGVFQGNGYTISGLKISRNGSVQGLFRYIQPTGVVSELNVSGQVAPGGTHSNVGGVAGINAGTVERCTFTGKVSGADSIGGIAGRNELTGIIDGCTVSGEIHGDHFVGGIAGESTGVIRLCENTASINTVVEQNAVDLSDITLDSITSSEAAVVTTDIGGIAGTSVGVIRECTNNGNVGYQHIGYNIGGIAGSQSGYITACVNNGQIFGRKEAGGIAGQMEPSTVLLYEPDTMQILEGQLDTLSGMIDDTAGSAQGTASELAGQMSSMQNHIENAQNALEQLVSGGEGELPDADSALAAMNTLTGSLSAMSGIVNSMSATSQESISSLSGNFNAITNQMGAIGQTIADGSEHMGGAILDASDNDTEEDTTGKIADCVNYGYIQADLNAGGIVGAMALENDLDPESDLQILGDSSLNYDCEARAVVLRCENHGTVNARRQNAGGITGFMALGLIRQSINTGRIDAASAKYVGGIAGQSEGFIRQCSVKCLLSGSSYIGGIAGTGSIVSGCRSMVKIESGSEKIGAVLGYTEKIIADDVEEEQPVLGNYYLPINSDIGGIDGISYNFAAQAIDSEAFFALEDVPKEFRVVIVTFVFEDGSERNVRVAQGGELMLTKIPAVPEKDGHNGCWDGLSDFDRRNVCFDTLFRLSYTPLAETVQSTNVRENGLPVLLVQGQFEDGYTLTLNASDESPVIEEKQTLAEVWSIDLEQCDSGTTVRYLLPDNWEHEQLSLIVKTSDGQWEGRSGTLDGRYLVFTADGSEQGIGLVHTPDSYLIELIAISATVLLLVPVIIIGCIRKKKTA